MIVVWLGRLGHWQLGKDLSLLFVLIFRTHTLWKDTLLSLDIVGISLVLPQNLTLSEEWIGGGMKREVGGNGRRGVSRDCD